jgi:hypothetical protein
MEKSSGIILRAFFSGLKDPNSEKRNYGKLDKKATLKGVQDA